MQPETNKTSIPAPRNQGGYGKGRQCAKLTAENAAYLAGFLDGEGCIGAYRRKAPIQKLLHLAVTVINTNRQVLDWIAGVTGVGTVNEHKTPKAGHKNFFLWQVQSEAAASLLEQLLPFLKVKREQAMLLVSTHRRAVENPEAARDAGWQNARLARFRELNRKGPEFPNATVQ